MAEDTFSSESRAGHMAGRAFLMVLVVLACSALAGQREAEYEGEHGLWVRLAGDSVFVHWLTDARVPGTLSVTGGDTRTYDTPAGRSHRVAFPAPARPVVELRYGSADTTHATLIDLAVPARGPAISPGVDSLFIVGDTHGDPDALISGLQAAHLIDDDLRWSGGRSHLVFAGDLTDRGPDVLRVLWLVYRLEREAAAAGGRVHVLLGNHEIMVMLSDLRYVHPKETEVAELHGTPYDRMFDVRESLLGRWLAARPAVVRIGSVLVTHGGIAHETVRLPIQAFDDTLALYMGEDLFYRWADTLYVPALDSASLHRRSDFFWGPRSVFWHRDYVQTDTLTAELDHVLDAWNATVLVVGHTAVPQIEARYGGRLIPAHTRRYGAELLLLVRDPNVAPERMRRYRISAGRPPERF
jgi:hypothetical protein